MGLKFGRGQSTRLKNPDARKAGREVDPGYWLRKLEKQMHLLDKNKQADLMLRITTALLEHPEAWTGRAKSPGTDQVRAFADALDAMKSPRKDEEQHGVEKSPFGGTVGSRVESGPPGPVVQADPTPPAPIL